MRRRYGKIRPTSRVKDLDENYRPAVRKTQRGVWNVVTEVTPPVKGLPAFRLLHINTSYGPYLRRFASDLFSISPWLLLSWLSLSVVNAFIPAVTLYWSSRLLEAIQEATENRAADIDERDILSIAAARLLCTVASRLLPFITYAVPFPMTDQHLKALDSETICATALNLRIRRFFEEHLLHAHVRLDAVTFKDPKVLQELQLVSPESYSSAWRALSECVRLGTGSAQLVAQIYVLAGIMRGQTDGVVFLLLTLLGPVIQWLSRLGIGDPRMRSFYASSTNQDYLRMVGYHQLAYEGAYREDICSNDLQVYIQQTFHDLAARLGDTALPWRDEMRRVYHSSISRPLLQIISGIWNDLPQVVFALTALRSPSIPLTLTWLALLRETVTSISDRITLLTSTTESLDDHFESIKALYRCAEIENIIMDGDRHYPLAEGSSQGMAVEFNSVGFKYPGSEKWALRDVSFKIEPGELCVIVGKNGSGKSSAVKLISRLYDCQEGEILIDEAALPTLRLSDFRKCVSTLPQDFTYFPLTVEENIALGSPEHIQDMDRIRRAAELGGSLEFIERDLPDGFRTRLKGPNLFNMHTSDQQFAQWANKEAEKHRVPDLSGGQWQKLALSRTFMRSESSRLLCYDEPSAALDPIAEYDLFQRLRTLRGLKSMIFVTHRFGHLTRHADRIVVLDEGKVVEQGNHVELLAMNGLYAKLYNLQALAFSPTP